MSWSDKEVHKLPLQDLPGVSADVADVRRWIDAPVRVLTQPQAGSGERPGTCCLPGRMAGSTVHATYAAGLVTPSGGPAARAWPGTVPWPYPRLACPTPATCSVVDDLPLVHGFNEKQFKTRQAPSTWLAVRNLLLAQTALRLSACV